MSRLKVMLRGAAINEIGLNTEKEYIGGRKEGCDIRLQPEKGISREHFRLKYTDGRWQLHAVSRFGDVFSLGQKIDTVLLDHAQAFQIPPYEFQFLDVPESEITNASGSPEIINYSENEKTVLGVSPQVPYVKVVNSNGDVREMLRLEVGDIWVAGRDPSCQIVIPDQRVSRRQFEIHKVNGIYTVIDLVSVNGTFLNGSPISSTDPQTLKSGDLLTVLDNQMYFELHDPNFKYKVEKIDIPPIPFEKPSDFANSKDNEISFLNNKEIDQNAIQNLDPNESQQAESQEQLPVEIPQIQQENINPQIDPSGGPFTGMPSDMDPNQYYSFQQEPQQTPLKKNGWQKLKSNKPLLIFVVLVFLGAAYWLSEEMNQPEPIVPPVQVSNSADPFTKLTPAQQGEIKELYTLVDQMMTQQKYDLALEKINKIHELLPTGYKDTMALKNVAEQSLHTIVQQQKDEELAKEKEENAKKIIEITTKCEKILNPSITVDHMRECLTPMALIDPSASDYTRLLAAAENIEKERQLKDAQTKTSNQQIAELQELFTKAEKVQEDGFAFKAIKQYKLVEKSSLPDPNKLKEKAKSRISFIQEKISEKSQKGIIKADELFKEAKIKQAVLSLRESQVYDPENPKIKERIDSYTQELRRQVRLLYQESIIDESYGLVDSTETKQGAKEKWKKITELDLDDGEYFRKAVIKLKRYGVM